MITPNSPGTLYAVPGNSTEGHPLIVGNGDSTHWRTREYRDGGHVVRVRLENLPEVSAAAAATCLKMSREEVVAEVLAGTLPGRDVGGEVMVTRAPLVDRLTRSAR